MSQLNIARKEFDVLRVFNENAVEYLVIGGYAMQFYGSSREVADLDLLTNNSPENAARLFSAIKKLIGRDPGFSQQQLELERKLVNFRADGADGYELEILTSIGGLPFADARSERSLATVSGIEIPIISKNHLIYIKQIAATDESRKEKELKDIEHLLES